MGYESVDMFPLTQEDAVPTAEASAEGGSRLPEYDEWYTELFGEYGGAMEHEGADMFSLAEEQDGPTTETSAQVVGSLPEGYDEWYAELFGEYGGAMES
jgi:hypothetical protein